MVAPVSEPSTPIGNGGTFAENEIRAQLDQILASPAFDASGRNRAFLRYVVEETIAGRAAFIKGYTVAQSVFGRGADFDPQLDPVVRIEASRLRRSLERYYLTDGRSDALCIQLPKGGYVPQFVPRGDDGEMPTTSVPSPITTAAVRTSTANRGPSIIVLPFENLGGELNGDLLARGITEELIGRLLAYKQLSVICANTSFKLAGAADAEAVGRRLALGYVLKGSIRIAGGRLRIGLQLLDVENSEYLWAESFDRELTSNDVWSVQEEVAAEVATRLGAPYGGIARVSQELLSRRAQPGVDDYMAILKAYGYRRQMTPLTHAEIRSCLEQAVAASPTFFEAWAQLALVYLDEYRFGLNPQPNPVDRALAAAEHAVKWGNNSALAHLALSLAHHYRYQHEQAYAGARRAISLNPDNPEVLAQAATRFVLSGAWSEGMILLGRAMQRDPDPPPWNYILLTLDALRRRDFRAALGYAEAASPIGLPHVGILQCVTYAGLGEQERAVAALDAARSGGRDLSDLWEQVRRSVHDDDLLNLIDRGLKQAGGAQHNRHGRATDGAPRDPEQPL